MLDFQSGAFAARAYLWLPFLSLFLPLPGARVAAQGSPAPDATLHITLRTQIGGDLVPESYAFHRVSDVAAAPGGEIYVLDVGDKTVKVFDPHGRFVRRFGREGGGPGEFLVPLAIEVDSVVRVFDGQQQRVSIFSLTGIHRDTHRLPAMQDPPAVSVRPLRGGGLLGVTPARFSFGSKRDEPHAQVVYRAAGSTKVDTLISYHSGGAVWNAAGKAAPWGIAPSSFGAAGAAAVHGDSLVAVVDGYIGSVRWYRTRLGELDLLHEGSLALTSPRVSEADIRDVEERLRSESGTSPGRVEVHAPPRWSIGSRAIFADDASLWVRSSVDSERGFVWTVFPRIGGPPRVIRMPPNFDLQAIRGDRMYGLAKTANDAQLVRVFQWTWR